MTASPFDGTIDRTVPDTLTEGEIRSIERRLNPVQINPEAHSRVRRAGLESRHGP